MKSRDSQSHGRFMGWGLIGEARNGNYWGLNEVTGRARRALLDSVLARGLGWIKQCLGIGEILKAL